MMLDIQYDTLYGFMSPVSCTAVNVQNIYYE
jgi:hypothetical protein